MSELIEKIDRSCALRAASTAEFRAETGEASHPRSRGAVGRRELPM